VGLALERAEAAARLAEQKEELEARNAEQETFIYTVSHDLRAPLLSIQGMGELLEEAVDAGDPEEARFLLRRVTRNAEKMGELLNDLLALSRVGRAAEDAEALDLGEVTMGRPLGTRAPPSGPGSRGGAPPSLAAGVLPAS
jgi:signal transduction histidine kinase